MSKRINNSKIVACMLALGFMAVGSGCTDSDFDLSSIDSTIGLGGDGLQLPACSTEDMLLDDVLDLTTVTLYQSPTMVTISSPRTVRI